MRRSSIRRGGRPPPPTVSILCVPVGSPLTVQSLTDHADSPWDLPPGTRGPLALAICDQRKERHRWMQVAEDEGAELSCLILKTGGEPHEALRMERTVWRQERKVRKACHGPRQWMRPSEKRVAVGAVRGLACDIGTWCQAWVREAMPQVLLSGEATQLEEPMDQAGHDLEL